MFNWFVLETPVKLCSLTHQNHCNPALFFCSFHTDEDESKEEVKTDYSKGEPERGKGSQNLKQTENQTKNEEDARTVAKQL